MGSGRSAPGTTSGSGSATGSSTGGSCTECSGAWETSGSGGDSGRGSGTGLRLSETSFLYQGTDGSVVSSGSAPAALPFLSETSFLYQGTSSPSARGALAGLGSFGALGAFFLPPNRWISFFSSEVAGSSAASSSAGSAPGSSPAGALSRLKRSDVLYSFFQSTMSGTRDAEPAERRRLLLRGVE